MKKLLIIVLLGFAQFTFGQVRVTLKNLASVTFPSTPAKAKTDAYTTVYSANHNGAFYIATVIDMSNKFDYSTNADSLLHFYDALRERTLKKQNAKLDFKETTNTIGVKGVEFGYTLNTKGSIPDTRVQRSIYLNKTLITFAVWASKAKLEISRTDKEIFFNTIAKPGEEAPPAPYQAAVKNTAADTTKAPAQQAPAKAEVNRAGYSVGYLLGAVILTAFIIGLIVLIRKTSSSNKKKK
jgi:hypothetical protein